MVVHKNAAAKRRYTVRPRSGPVVITRLHPLAEECALFLAQGNRTRLRVISASTVIVVNH
jgi:hypothetical protein